MSFFVIFFLLEAKCRYFARYSGLTPISQSKHTVTTDIEMNVENVTIPVKISVINTSSEELSSGCYSYRD